MAPGMKKMKRKASAGASAEEDTKKAKVETPTASSVEAASASEVVAPMKKKKKVLKKKAMKREPTEGAETASKEEAEAEELSEQEEEEKADEKESDETVVAPAPKEEEQATTTSKEVAASTSSTATTVVAGTTSSASSSSKTAAEVTTDLSFATLGLHENLVKGLDEAGFTKMFEIQRRSIPPLLRGEDVLGAAKTGSGKTLAFLVPMIDTLVKIKFLQRNGTGVLVIAPTRELADQIYGVCREICKYISQTHGVVLGGMNRREEARRLEKGVSVLVATPGRLLDHMQNTKGFVYHNLTALVLDEADRILEIGFEEEMKAILRLLPPKRQTALFSATQTKKVADLVRLSMKRPVFVEVKGESNAATRAGLEQGYVLCPSDRRFLLLYTFLKKEKKKKMMVFMSSKHAVKFYHDLLNYIDIPVECIHGDKKQSQRQSVFHQFSTATSGVLLCTDVAARGLDIPKVDWIVQFDPPDDPREYIHRVGRTARGATGTGKALLFLLPEELGFLRYLKQSNVTPNEYTFPESKVANIQTQLERLIEKNYHLHRGSRDAYRSYIHAYAAHSLKDCFQVHKLDLQKVAKSFGFDSPPKVELGIKHRVKTKAASKGKKASEQASGHAFSAENPYGKREASDKRQFMH
ncbi:unnamed protein product [Amoebophrya sp. A25]|nr:unnamed protein product [Amoebophrya sp. A25]|eukprot:GSA25T00021156001.1